MRGGYDDTASDRLLREAGALRRAGDPEPCYTEAELRRHVIAHEILIGADHTWSEDSMLYADMPPGEDKRLTWHELMGMVHATARQRQYLRCMLKLGRTALVAEECGVEVQAVRRGLCRLFLRMEAALPAVTEAMPERWAADLFWEEIRHKHAQVYHAPPRQKVSAYRHERSRQEMSIRRERDRRGRFVKSLESALREDG